MASLHLQFPDDYEMCAQCTGTGTVTVFRDGELRRIRCDNSACQDGSIRRRRKRSSFADPPGNSAGTIGTYAEALSSANEIKAKVLNEISENMSALQPKQLPYPYNRWSLINTDIENNYKAAREQYGKLYVWISGLNPADVQTEALLRDARESWSADESISRWLGLFEQACALLRISSD